MFHHHKILPIFDFFYHQLNYQRFHLDNKSFTIFEDLHKYFHKLNPDQKTQSLLHQTFHLIPLQ